MSGTQCTYTGTARSPKICGRVCDPGQTLCPRHIVVSAEDQRRKREKEDAKADAATKRNAGNTVRI